MKLRTHILSPLTLMVAIAAAGFTGCDSEDDGDSNAAGGSAGGAGGEGAGGEGAGGMHEGEEPLGEHACIHFTDGPFEDVTASETAEGAPDVAFEHTRVGITLHMAEAGSEGYVTFAASEAADLWLFLGQDVPLEITDASGNAVTPEESVTEAEGCDAIAAAHKVEFDVGTYTLRFGPSTDPIVHFVYEEAEHEGEEGHEDHDHE